MPGLTVIFMSVFIYTAKLRQTIGLDSPFWAQYWLIGRQSGFGLFVLSLFVCLKRLPLPETSAWDAASRRPADPSVHLRIWRLGSQRPLPACIFRIGHLRSRRTAAVRSTCSLTAFRPFRRNEKRIT